MDPTRDLLKAYAYTVVEVLEAVAVTMHSSDPKYRDCDCDPNVGLMGHKDLMVALGPNIDISNAVVVVVGTRAMVVLQTDCFALQGDNHV